MSRRPNRRNIQLGIGELAIDERFQARNPIANGARKYGAAKRRGEEHIAELVRMIEDTEAPLERITVWQDAKKWYVVDGFHRYAAYRKAVALSAWRTNRKIPCRIVLAKDAHEAQRQVFSRNLRPQLGFTQAERIEAAWQELVRLERDGIAYTLRPFAQQFCVGRTTVSEMRKVIARMRACGNTLELPSPWIVHRHADDPDMDKLKEAQAVGQLRGQLLKLLEGKSLGVQLLAVRAVIEALEALDMANSEY